ncbi:MAG: tetratricopeptide repeat protein [Planctomycetota bacterium]
MTRFRHRLFLALTILATIAGGFSISLLRRSVPAPRLPDLSTAADAAVSAIRREWLQADAEPTSAERRGNLGSVLLAHQFDCAAAAEFRIASELDPASFRWKYLQGLAETPASRNQAMESFRAAAALRGDSWLPRIRLAELLLAENQLDPARELILEARRLAPNELRPALAEIRLELLEQQPEAAVAIAEPLRKAGVRVRELSELYAATLFQLGRAADAHTVAHELHDEALESAGWNDPFAAAVLGFSTDPADIIAEARSLAALGRISQAITRLRSAPPRTASHADFVPTLVRLLLEDGRALESLPVLDEGLRTTPGSPSLRHLRGSALFLLGRYAEAEAAFRDALQIKPDLALARLNLAHCLLRTSGRSAAVTALEDTLRTAPEMHSARLLLISLLLEESRLPEAAAQLQSLQKMLPPDHPEFEQLQRRLTQLQTPATP